MADFIEKRQTSECLDIGGIEDDSYPGPYLFEQVESAGVLSSESPIPTDPRNVHLIPAVRYTQSQGPADPLSQPARSGVYPVRELVSAGAKLVPGVEPGLP